MAQSSFKGSVKVTDRDLGYEALLKRTLFGDSSISVGVLAAEGESKHDVRAIVKAAVNEKKKIAVEKLSVGLKALSGGFVSKSDLVTGKQQKDRIKAAKEGAKSKALTVLEIATIHEFGLGHNPERSFIRAWFDEKKDENELLMKKVAEQYLAGKITREQGLDLLGVRFVGSIQKRIRDRIEPPLASSTEKRKGSSVPLIDTGQLRSSITFKVNK